MTDDNRMAGTRRVSTSSYRQSLEDQIADMEAVSVRQSLPEGFEPSITNAEIEDEVDSQKPVTVTPKSPKESVIDLYKLLAVLTLGAILGVLARRGLTSLSTYNGAYISGVVWSNFAASTVMGFAIESQEIWSHESLVREYTVKAKIPLYIGLTTGLCGSLSSFSSMILEAFEKAADLAPTGFYHYPNAAYGIMEVLSVFIAQISMSLAAFHLGRHIGQLSDTFAMKLSLKHYKIIEYIVVALGTVGFIMFIALAAAEDHARAWTLSCVFGPFGAYTRFYLSRLLNPLVKDFPAGTFACNLIGSLLLAIFNLLSRGKLDPQGQIVSTVIGCQVLAALSDGYCGCLTTVSTFVAELYGLKLVKAYRYGFISVVVCFVVLLLVLGPYNWSTGFTTSVC